MLVLTRRINESIVINGDIVVTVLEVGRNGQVRLGIDAPRHYQIYRRELWLEIEQENRNALASALSDSSGATAAVPPSSATPVPGPTGPTGPTPPPARNGKPKDEPTPTGSRRSSP